MSPASETVLDHQEFLTQTLVHFDTLYHAALTFTRRRADAQDLVQDTYLKAFRFWQHFQPGTNVRAWLLTILRHAFINAYRQTVRRQAQEKLYVSSPEGPALDVPVWTDYAVLDDMLRHIVQDEVKQALEELPEPFRVVVILADLEEYSYKDIAVRLGCPVGTVMSRLCRGRKHLRQRLATFASTAGYLRTTPAEG